MAAGRDLLTAAGRRRTQQVSHWVAAGGHQRMWTLWAIARVFGITVVLVGLTTRYSYTWGSLGGDVVSDYAAAHAAIMDGHLPYLNYAYEYPPGTIPYVAIPIAVSDNSSWLLTFCTEMLVLDALVLRALRRSCLPHRHAAQLVWIVGGLLTWGLFVDRNDLEAIAPVVLGLLALVADRRARSMGWLVLGVFTKLWPVLLLAVALVSRPKLLRPTAIATAIASAVFLLPIVALGATSNFWHDLVEYHGKRGVEVEAIIALPTLFQRTLTGHQPAFDRDYGSLNLANSGALAIAASIATVAAVGLVVGRLAIRRYREGTIPLATVLQACCLIVTLSLLTTKVLSPQYFSWLLGVSCVALAAGAITRRDAALVLATMALTGAEFPLLFWDLGASGASALIVESITLLRAALLVALVVRWAPSVFRGQPQATVEELLASAEPVPTLLYR